jgi:hypothetical protein
LQRIHCIIHQKHSNGYSVFLPFPLSEGSDSVAQAKCCSGYTVSFARSTPTDTVYSSHFHHLRGPTQWPRWSVAADTLYHSPEALQDTVYSGYMFSILHYQLSHWSCSVDREPLLYYLEFSNNGLSFDCLLSLIIRLLNPDNIYTYKICNGTMRW